METLELRLSQEPESIQPNCPYVDACVGCCAQHISYQRECDIKEIFIRELLSDLCDLPEDVFQPIIPSVKSAHYRHRLDLKLIKNYQQEILIGYTPADSRGILPIDSCHIAMESISEYIPQLKQEAISKLPENYKNANLVVRTSDDGRVHWGGIGKHSLRQLPQDYLWTELEGKRIYFSLESFFQANLSILPSVIKCMKNLLGKHQPDNFFDLYGGVGLFGIALSDLFKKVYLIEENKQAIELARYNVSINRLNHMDIFEGRVEDRLKHLSLNHQGYHVAMIDPPRAGLSSSASQLILSMDNIQTIFYLSCNPEALARDLKLFMEEGWKVTTVVPFDFFPRTKHLETLCQLEK